MDGRVGSPVVDCTPGGGASQPGATHKTCGIKILSIKEQDIQAGMEYKDGQNEIAVKGLDKPLRIQYEVKACAMTVTLSVEFDPGNAIHSNFYNAYEGKGINAPAVAIVVKGEAKSPGIHQASWDGRDQTCDHRILLDGTYNVRILGVESVTHKDVTTIRIMPPIAADYGIHYAGNTTKKEVFAARDAQQALADGTAFVSDASVSSPALDAWMKLRSSAVGVISGHSNPYLLVFYPEESQPGKPAAFTKKKQSGITMNLPDPDKLGDQNNNVSLMGEPENALRDVFLVILAGCRAGNETLAVQQRLKQLSTGFNPGGIDGDHGPKTTAALQAWQSWEGIKPPDGTKNQATLDALGVDSTLDEKPQTREVQKKLKNFSKRYDPGPEDGVWGDKTEAALTHYQEDHSPPLEVTSLPDKATLEHLGLTDSSGGVARNIAETFMQRGCNIVFGFIKKVSFSAAEKWHIGFWESAVAGSTIADAASEARTNCGAVKAKTLDYSFYTRDGVSTNCTVHPARHGKDI